MRKRSLVVSGLALLALARGASASQYITLLSPSQVSGLAPLQPGGAQTFTFKIDASAIAAKYKMPLVQVQLRVLVDTTKTYVPGMHVYGPIIAHKNLVFTATSASVTLDEMKAGLKQLFGNELSHVPPLTWLVCAGPSPDIYSNNPACDCSQTSYSYQPPPTPTPVPPPDLAVSVEPDLPTAWPTAFRVRNLGSHFSDETTLDVSVEVLQGDLDVVKQNCHPRFTDFKVKVPNIIQKDSALLNPPPPEPMKIRYRPGLLKTFMGTPATMLCQAGRWPMS